MKEATGLLSKPFKLSAVWSSDMSRLGLAPTAPPFFSEGVRQVIFKFQVFRYGNYGVGGDGMPRPELLEGQPAFGT